MFVHVRVTFAESVFVAIYFNDETERFSARDRRFTSCARAQCFVKFNHCNQLKGN